MFEKLVELFKKVPRILDNVKDLSIAESFSAIVTPKGDQIDSLANISSEVTVCCPIVLAWETRLNEHTGICQKTGRPLYPETHWVTDIVERYLRLTPSVQGKRATGALETLGQGALNPPQQIRRGPDFGDEKDLFPKKEREV